MTFSKKTLTILALLLSFSPLFSQQTVAFKRQQTIAAKELQEDFKQMLKIIELHPAKYAFTTEAAFEKVISEQYAKITAPMTVAEFFDLCAGVIHNIGCGHTGLDMPDGFWKKGDQLVFPLPISIINDSLIVVQDFDADINVLSQITKINGKPFGDILNRIQNYISSDGFNATWKIARLNQSLNNFLSVYFNFPPQYEVVYRARGGSEKAVTFPAIRYDALKKASAPKDMLTYSVLKNDKIALMSIPSFNYYRKDSVKFFHTVNEFFSRVQSDNIQNLIVDFRGNSGGDPFCAAHLLSYLERKPFVYYSEFYDWSRNLSKPIAPKSKAFKGDLYILTDGLCFSTTGHLAALLKVNKVGTIVGDETGGTYTCNDSGRWFELKNSKLKLRMAQQTFKVAAETLPRDKGVLPDFPVNAYSQDVVTGKDVVLEYTLNMIERSIK